MVPVALRRRNCLPLRAAGLLLDLVRLMYHHMRITGGKAKEKPHSAGNTTGLHDSGWGWSPIGRSPENPSQDLWNGLHP
jgi:hypothetical protein